MFNSPSFRWEYSTKMSLEIYSMAVLSVTSWSSGFSPTRVSTSKWWPKLRECRSRYKRLSLISHTRVGMLNRHFFIGNILFYDFYQQVSWGPSAGSLWTVDSGSFCWIPDAFCEERWTGRGLENFYPAPTPDRTGKTETYQGKKYD